VFYSDPDNPGAGQNWHTGHSESMQTQTLFHFRNGQNCRSVPISTEAAH